MQVAWTRSLASLAASLVVVGTLGVTRPTEAQLELERCDGAHELFGVVPTKRDRFEALPDVTLSTRIEQKLNSIGASYEKKTGRTFVVTSGTRDAESQAEAIYDKLSLGEDILKLYKDKAAALELKRAYDAGRAADKSKSTIVVTIADTIRAQMRRGVYISAHLKAGAADVRTSTMTGAERRAFVDVARAAGGVLVLEETAPPHFHLQLE
jgi:hypothetical protein